MSLNWKLPENFNEKLIWKNKEESIVQPELQCLIFATIGIQHDLDGEMTDEKLKEIMRRVNLLNGLEGLPSYSLTHNNKYRKIKISIETIIRYWGLQTNVCHLKDKEWNKFLIRVSKVNEYDFNWEKEEALKIIKQYPDLIEGQRVLNEWESANPEIDITLTTPSPNK